jgi:hypothetical protein
VDTARPSGVGVGGNLWTQHGWDTEQDTGGHEQDTRGHSTPGCEVLHKRV